VIPSTEVDELTLFVSSDKTEWVIARDPEDAWTCWEEHTGDTRDDFSDGHWKPVPPNETLSIFVDSDGAPASPEMDGSEPLELAAEEWIRRRGRGWLCTTEC
jgi:hypothetical protein